MKRLLHILIGIALLITAGGCAGEPAKTVSAFVGSASKPPMEEAAQAFERETGIKVYANYGGSGAMLSQIELSRSGDIYIPGSPDFMAKAEHKGIIDPASVKIIAYLVPVIAVQKGNPLNIRSLADLARPGLKIGIANPEAVCVGLYAVELLSYNNLLADVGKNIIVNAESCDKTATLLSLKSVDAVIGWDVFHQWDPENIDSVYLAPEQLPRLAYIPAAVSSFAADKSGAEKFIDFLVSAKGQEIFQKWGYITSESEAKKFAPAAVIGGEYQLPADYRDMMK
jgi:molybdate transport system substrate-binding protein